jgi:hypothetical protein
LVLFKPGCFTLVLLYSKRMVWPERSVKYIFPFLSSYEKYFRLYGIMDVSRAVQVDVAVL